MFSDPVPLRYHDPKKPEGFVHLHQFEVTEKLNQVYSTCVLSGPFIGFGLGPVFNLSPEQSLLGILGGFAATASFVPLLHKTGVLDRLFLTYYEHRDRAFISNYASHLEKFLGESESSAYPSSLETALLFDALPHFASNDDVSSVASSLQRLDHGMRYYLSIFSPPVRRETLRDIGCYILADTLITHMLDPEPFAPYFTVRGGSYIISKYYETQKIKEMNLFIDHATSDFSRWKSLFS